MLKEPIIRFATIKDLQYIVDIYNQAIKTKSATGDIEVFKIEDRVEWFKKFNTNEYPLYIAEINKKVVGFCTISPYRPGRKAMQKVAEISYYVDYSYHKKGIGTSLLKFAVLDCNRINKKNLLAFVLDINYSTIRLLEKNNFKQLGYLPNIIEFDNKKCGHLIYGLRI
ncbi:MAG: GNAT family N-acetyltransferase [Lutibacter sp.]|uniref:GNAT family N-acetyltransferase n=1 Tax=Lutibacter sp. TaxID=1925666 RepID=UPI00385E4B75